MKALSQDQAVEKLFDSILDALASTGRFSDSSSPTSFVVYAHDVDAGEPDDSGPAHSNVVKQFIHWKHRLRTRTYSDQYPVGTFWHERRTNGDAACRDILENQLCLLPQKGAAAAADDDVDAIRTEKVQMVLVCGSPRLRSYCEHPFARGYIDGVKRAYEECRGSSIFDELRQRLQQEVSKAATSEPGFHHALTEIAFLELRCKYNPGRHGVVLVSLEQGIMDYLRFTQPTNLQLHINSSSNSSPSELQSSFFKLLRVLYPVACNAVNRYEQAYKSAKAEIGKRVGDMTEASLDNLFESFISRARRDLANHENAELHELFHKRQLADLGSAAFAILDTRRNRVLGELPTIPYRDRKDRNPERVEGTCRWFTRHAKFKEWHESESGGSILWVTAYPGCGKSVLLRHLVDTVLVAPNRAVCYFFFKDDFDDQKSVVGALRCLLHQVFVQRPELLDDKIIQKFEQDKQLLSSASDLWGLLDTITRDLVAGHIIIAIDALDECRFEDRRTFLRRLAAWAKDTNPTRLKFLITSRLRDDISRGFYEVGSEIRLKAENDTELQQISGEIQLVIMHRLRKNAAYFELTAEQQDLLHKEFSRIKHRTYLWVHLVQDEMELMKETDTKSLLAAVRNLPQDVYAAYEKILSHSGQRDKVVRMLSIIVAAARPLNLRELAVAWAITPDVSTAADVEVYSAEQMQRTLHGLCGLFVIVVEGRVYLLHQTAREFLLDKADVKATRGTRGTRGSRADAHWRGSLAEAEVELVMARICLQYFDVYGVPDWMVPIAIDAGPAIAYRESTLACDCPRSRQNHDEDCFVRYAFARWATHVARGHDAGGDELVSQAAGMAEGLSDAVALNYAGRPLAMPALTVASMLGLVSVVEFLSRAATTAELDRLDAYDTTALCRAAARGNTDVVRLLLARGANCDVKGPFDRTALVWAVERGDYAMAEMLVARGANVNTPDYFGRSALYVAIHAGKTAIVALLLANGAEHTAVDQNGSTLLMEAVGRDDMDSLLLLLQHGAAMEVVDKTGRNALAHACERGGPEVTRILLKKGADPAKASWDGLTPLMRCCEDAQDWSEKRSEVLELLLRDSRVNVNAQDHGGNNALSLACKAGFRLGVQRLLEFGATVDDRYLFLAAEGGHDVVVQMLLNAGADINTVGPYGDTVLTLAAANGRKALVDNLLAMGADVRHVLATATVHGQKDIVAVLLEHGAPVDTVGPGKNTALFEAAFHDYPDIVQLLLDNGADLNQPSHDGTTPLMAALKRGCEETVRILLGRKADVECVAKAGGTALYFAAHGGSVECVEMLLSHGADVNHRDDRAFPALSAAAYWGWTEVTRLLLAKGADSARRDVNGLSALDIAAEHGYLDMLELLLPTIHNVQLVRSAFQWIGDENSQDTKMALVQRIGELQ